MPISSAQDEHWTISNECEQLQFPKEYDAHCGGEKDARSSHGIRWWREQHEIWKYIIIEMDFPSLNQNCKPMFYSI